jgi:signal transduction histidine kinase
VHEAGATIFDYAAPCQWKTLDGEPCPPKELPLARAVLRQEVVTGVELIVVRPDGSELVVQDNAAPVTAPDGSFLGAVLTVRDVTAQRQLMTELVRVNRMKDEFLAILSHELRTPLTPILGWASLLRQTKGRNEEILDQAAEAIERNAETQKRLIEDLLDTTRMISGKLSIEVRPANLNDLIALTVASAERAVIGRDIRIEAELDERLPQLDIDEVRMQQVLWNLLSNAIKFSHDGGTIQVRSRLAGGQSDHAPTHAEVEVRDQGQGIVPDVLPHIFELFRQGDSSYTRRHGGLGLGLAITRSLVEMHGGTIEAKSAGEECGTQFLIRLPLPRQEKLPGTTRI